MKYSKTAGVVTWSQGMMPLARGMSFDDTHPLVKERPDLFDDVEPGAVHKAPTRVESGLQRPGEQRMAKTVQAPPRGSKNNA